MNYQNSEEITFSVIVPVFNTSRYLQDCVSSVLKQSYKNYEIILVDDGSTDNSPQMCDDFAKKHHFIKVIHKSNSGPLQSRREGLSLATGQWVIYLDSDDRLKENALKTLSNKILQYKNVDCIVIGFERLIDDSIGEITDGVVKQDTLINDKRQICRTILFNANYNVVWRKVAKRSISGKDDLSQWYSIRFGEDQIQTIELLKYCNSFLFVPEVLYQYRVNTSGITWTRNYSDFKVSFLKEELIINFLRSENIFTEEDFADYRNYLNSWLCVNLVEVATAKTSLGKKLETYKKYRSNRFFEDFLSKEIDKHVLILLWKKQYRRLLFECLRIKAVSVLLHKSLSFS